MSAVNGNEVKVMKHEESSSLQSSALAPATSAVSTDSSVPTATPIAAPAAASVSVAASNNSNPVHSQMSGVPSAVVPTSTTSPPAAPPVPAPASAPPPSQTVANPATTTSTSTTTPTTITATTSSAAPAISGDQKVLPKSHVSTAANLFVTNIPGNIDKLYFEKLIEPFAQNGAIREIKFFKRVVEESCYAFIHFESAVDGSKCMNELNRRILNGHTMRVGPASKRDPLLSQTNLYIEGVPKEWTDFHLRKHFAEFGEIAAARILVDKDTMTSREVGFIHYTTHEDALSAMETLQDQKAYPEAQRSFKIKFANKVRKKDDFGMDMYRDHSRYRHSFHESEMNTPRYNEACRYWLKGGCMRGKDCFYQHGNASIHPQPAHPAPTHYAPPHHHHRGHPPSYAPPPGHATNAPPPYNPYSAGYPHPATAAASASAAAAAAAASASGTPSSAYPHSQSAYYSQYYNAPTAPATGGNGPYYAQTYSGYPYQAQYAQTSTASYPSYPQQQAPPVHAVPAQTQPVAHGQSGGTGKGAKTAAISSEEQKTNPNSGSSATPNNSGAANSSKNNAVPGIANGTASAVQPATGWYPPVVAPSNGVQPMYVNPGYGASRQPATAATNARWDPYRAQMASQQQAPRGYMPPATRQ